MVAEFDDSLLGLWWFLIVCIRISFFFLGVCVCFIYLLSPFSSDLQVAMGCNRLGAPRTGLLNMGCLRYCLVFLVLKSMTSVYPSSPYSVLLRKREVLLSDAPLVVLPSDSTPLMVIARLSLGIPLKHPLSQQYFNGHILNHGFCQGFDPFSHSETLRF